MSKVIGRNELIPLQRQMLELNTWVGEEAVRFEAYNHDVTDSTLTVVMPQ